MSGRFSPADVACMQEALALAARARYRCHPNPQVGCVIVRDGQVVGRGYHQRRGGPHAEVHALREAGDRARGATVYVTLEPCSHHGLTPPCADALIAAGVARVVAAMADPDPRVAGQGLARLRAAGIQVEVGLLEAEARALNRPWLHWIARRRPYVLLKAGLSLDGKIAAASGESRWITGEAARTHAHQVRDQVEAILVGIGTVLQDNPALTARPPAPGPLALGWDLPAPVRHSPALTWATDLGPWEPRHPLRVILDSLGRTPLTAAALPALVAVTPVAPRERVAALEAAGAEVLVLPADRNGVVSLPPLLEELGRRGIVSLLVEGGGQVHWSFLAEGMADGALFYLSPRLLGGRSAPGAVAGPGFRRLAEAPRLRQPVVEPVGEDLMVVGDLEYPAAAPGAEAEGA
ncbi:MAG: bifunctional diaminohydroxyphosphoribosylaminopyrimidine deaminase/5-amino-6-(5-phosphoribosylamino)uracil reductase RibD [Bacillota bacterium]